MGKYLSGSAQTGAKIMKNLSLFTYNFTRSDNSSEAVLYHFDWTFDGTQFGHICIKVRNQEIANGSLIATDRQSPRKFSRDLGLYNDSSLGQVFSTMMLSIGIQTTGFYSESL